MGRVIAQLGVPDMRIPIAYALSFPRRLPRTEPLLDLSQDRRFGVFQTGSGTISFTEAGLCGGPNGGDACRLL